MFDTGPCNHDPNFLVQCVCGPVVLQGHTSVSHLFSVKQLYIKGSNLEYEAYPYDKCGNSVPGPLHVISGAIPGGTHKYTIITIDLVFK